MTHVGGQMLAAVHSVWEVEHCLPTQTRMVLASSSFPENNEHLHHCFLAKQFSYVAALLEGSGDTCVVF